MERKRILKQLYGEPPKFDPSLVEELLRDVELEIDEKEEIREAQAQKLWDAFGKELRERFKYETLDDYLADIPEVPNWPEDYPEYLDRDVLVDTRIPLTKQCALLGVQFNGNDETFEDYEPNRAKEGIYWMRAQDGRKNRNISPKTCRKQFAENEVGLTAVEGLALFLQDKTVIENHVIDLPGSVHRGNRESCAWLEVWSGEPGLSWRWGGNAHAEYGSGSRGE